jgi:hypothetical protein
MLQNIKDNTCRVTISVKHGSLTNILDWCEKNCTENWYFTDPPHSYYVDSWSFVFHSEKDFVMFNLRWM